MKSLKFIFAITATLFFISCDNEEDDTTPVTSETIIGSWSTTALEADILIEGDINGIPFVSDTRSIGENFDYVLTFTETEYTAVGGYDLVTTGTLNGETITTDTTSIRDISETGTYSFDDGTITFDGQLFEFNGDDLEMSNQTLDIAFNADGDLVITQEINIDMTEGVFPNETSINAAMVLERQ